jgi:hypothetical protein
MSVMTAKDRLILSLVKVERAKHHLDDFDRIAESFRERYAEISVINSNVKAIAFSQSLPDIRTYPVRSFALFAAAGDIVNNLRSALDHLAWQLVEAVGNTPSKHTGFPIAPSAETYEETKARKVEGMSPEAVRLIDSLKPYQGGNEALWRLHEINNIDKHQTIVSVGENILLEGSGFDGYFWKRATNPHFYRLFPPTTNNEANTAADESPPEPKALESKTLVPFLHDIVTVVDAMIKQFEPLL